MRLVLHDWGPSPFCLKVRAILDYKGMDYQRRPLQPVSIARVARRGKVGKVPALEVDDRMVVDSTDIALELERLQPAPSILPDDPRDRALCHAIEEWADESVYFVGLYFQWRDPDGARRVPQAFKGPNKLIYPFYRRRVLRQIVGQGTGRKPPELVAHDLERHLDAATDLLEDTCVLGPLPTLADFALAAQLLYLQRTPHGAARLEQRPRLTAYLEHMRGYRSVRK